MNDPAPPPVPEPSTETPTPELRFAAEPCIVCGRALKPDAAFCGGCGHRRPRSQPPSELRTLIAFYLTSLGLATIGMIYGRITDDWFGMTVAVTLGLGVITLGFALAKRTLVATTLRTIGFGPLGYLLILVASIPIIALVAGYVDLVHHLFGIHVPNELEVFQGHPSYWPVLLVILLPPLEEELAFRGLIFTGLRRTLSVTDAFLLSSFAFAMLHLSIPSLVTHLPLGLYFCYLRHRSGSIWPGVFAHACHNLGVCVLAWW